MAATPPPQKPIFDQIMQDGKLGRDPEHQAHALDMLNEFITQVTAAAGKGGTDPVAFIQKQIDASERLFNVMLEDHKQRFDKIAAVYLLSESLQKKLNERDLEIARLRQQLRIYESIDFM